MHLVNIIFGNLYGRVWKPQTVTPYPVPKSVPEYFSALLGRNLKNQSYIISVMLTKYV